MRNLSILIVVILMNIVSCLPARAGWIWTEDGVGAYTGTASPWAADSSVTGKWVKLGQNNQFTSDLNVTGGVNLTIDGATVRALETIDGTAHNGRVAQDATETTLTVQNGGKLLLSNTLSVSDASGVSIGRVVLNNGTLESLSDIRIGFHYKGYLDITNGGSLITATKLFAGGEGNRVGEGYVTIGGLDSETNTGTVQCANLIVGHIAPSTFTINRGTVTVTQGLIVGTNTPAAGTVDIAMDVNDFGTLNVTNAISLANHATKDVSLNVKGGTVTATQIRLGDAAGKGTMNLKSGIVTVADEMIVGNNAAGVGYLNQSGGEMTVNGNVKIGNSGTGTFTMTGGTFTTAQTTSVNSKSTLQLSGGTFTTKNLTAGTGNIYLGSAEAETRADVTATMVLALAGNNSHTLYVQNADVKAGEINIGTGGSNTAVLDIGAGGIVTVQPANTTVISETTKNTGLLRISQSSTGLLYIHDGGKFVHNGARCLAGDSKTLTSYVTVDGAGSLMDVNTTDFNLGYHGNAVVTVTNGGTIDAVGDIRLGVNKANETVAPSVLTLSGEGSLVRSPTQLVLGSGAQKGILNLNASRTGLGCVEVGTLNRANNGSEINFGLDHGLMIIEKESSTSYEVIKAGTLTNWAVNRNDFWNLTENEGSVVAVLNTAKRQAGKLDLETLSVEIAEGLQTAGWIELDANMMFNIQLAVDGASDPETMKKLAAWLSGGDETATAEVTGNSIRFSDVLPTAGTFLWDLNTFNAVNNVNLKLANVEAFVPEPCSWVLLLLCCAGICALKKGKSEKK